MEFSFLVYTISKKALTIFANTVVRWDQLCAAILRRNGRVEFSFLVYTISKKGLALDDFRYFEEDSVCIRSTFENPLAFQRRSHFVRSQMRGRGFGACALRQQI